MSLSVTMSVAGTMSVANVVMKMATAVSTSVDEDDETERNQRAWTTVSASITAIVAASVDADSPRRQWSERGDDIRTDCSP